MKVPPALAGKTPSEEQRRALYLFLLAHPDRKQAGLVFTARLANEAIDWYNEEGPDYEALGLAP